MNKSYKIIRQKKLSKSKLENQIEENKQMMLKKIVVVKLKMKTQLFLTLNF